jgi:hypothetical protein
MNPDVLTAVERLRKEGVLRADLAARLTRVARDGLVSVHLELRVALYAGVLLLTGGIGLLVKQQLEHLGPLAVALGLSLLTALSFAWVARHAPAFTWGEAAETHLAFDYILLLGVLLGAADLAYVEAHFTPLGEAWPWHLLIVSLLAAALSVRCDSRVVFSLALSTFAAWRGVSVSLGAAALWDSWRTPETLRGNAIGCGLLYLVLGRALARTRRKAHFEPVATPLGWLLLLGALLSGIDPDTAAGLAWTLLTLGAGAGLMAWGWRARRFLLLAMGVVAVYVGLSALFHRLEPEGTAVAGWYLVTSLALVVGLFLAHRQLKEDA